MKISGVVISGDKRGRELGFPTANIEADTSLDVLQSGVYAAVVEIAGLKYRTMANLGTKPTFPGGDGRRILELYLLDFEGDLYGRELSAELIEFIRPEQKFGTPDDLRTQIEKDKIKIENILCI